MTVFIFSWSQLNSSFSTPEALRDELPTQAQHSKNLNEEQLRNFTQFLMQLLLKAVAT